MAQEKTQLEQYNVVEEKERRIKQLVIVTGAASGIGRECLRWFAREGYNVLGLDLSFENEVEFRKSLSLDRDDNLCLENCDVTKYEEFRAIVDKFVQKNENGYVNCLINNAGIKYSDSIDKQDLNEWSHMLNVNIMGVLNGIRCVVDKMKEHKDGCIINIGDSAAHTTFANHTVYCATKRAVCGITEGIRCELMQYNIKVVGINPGAVDTSQFVHSRNKNVEKESCAWKDSLKHGLLQPDDVARCCLFSYQQPKRCLIREIKLAPLEQKR